MTEKEIDKFEKIQSQLNGFYAEVGILSKKNPNDALNKFKLNFINQILKEATQLLVDEYKPFQGFDTFNVDEIPTNSDVTMILEQYLSCLEKLRSDCVSSKEVGLN